jgi:hypothetical protein
VEQMEAASPALLEPPVNTPCVQKDLRVCYIHRSTKITLPSSFRVILLSTHLRTPREYLSPGKRPGSSFEKTLLLKYFRVCIHRSTVSPSCLRIP